jgi:hypothetical protein
MDSDRASHRMIPLVLSGLVAAILFGFYLRTLAPGLTWAHYGVDGGDLIAAAVTLGIPHPTGYPTYTLLAHFFIDWLNLGEPAYEGALLSAVSTSLAAAAFSLLLMRAMPQDRPYRHLLGPLVGLALGLSPLVWSQAVIVEVYGLHFLFLVLGLWLVWRLGDPGRPIAGTDYVLACLMGLGMGNHVTLVLMLPLWAALILVRRRRKALRLSTGAGLGLAFLLGLAVYLYLPLRAGAYPPVNWGVPNTMRGFLWTVTARAYQGLAFGLPLEAIPDRLSAWSKLLLGSYGVVGLLFGLMGLVMGRSTSRAVDRSAVWMLLVYSVFAIGYNTADSADYLIPAHLAFGWFVAHGIVFASQEVLGRLPPRAAWASWLPLALFAASLAWGVPAAMKQSDASQDRRASEYGLQAMEQSPPGAVMLTWEATDAFPLWYYQYALGMRLDVAILVVPLMQFDWYYDVVRTTYPGLHLGKELFTQEAVRSGAVLLALSDRPRCQAVREGQEEDLRLRVVCPSPGDPGSPE